MKYPHQGLSLLFMIFMLIIAGIASAEEFRFPVESNLSAGIAKVDITPAPTTPVVGHVRPTNGIRDPIRAGVLILNNKETQVAIVTLDLISASSDMVQQLREAISSRTKTPEKNIMIATSHNHSGPGWNNELEWSRNATKKIADASEEAAKSMRPVNIGYGEDRIDFNINRRKVIDAKTIRDPT